MTRALPRTHFNSSRLLRVLADLTVLEPPEPGRAFAEKLGQWLDVTDAIALSAVLSARPAVAAPAAGAAGAEDGRMRAADEADEAGDARQAREAESGVAARFARCRDELAAAIVRSCSPQAGATRIKLPLPTPGTPAEIAADFEPYRRFHLALQRDMETRLRPLRGEVRAALAQASPALAKLAALDANLDEVLAARESRLLATLPLLLEKRFVQLRETYRQAVAATSAVDAKDAKDAVDAVDAASAVGEPATADDPAAWLRPGGWLAVFCQELQALLLAELELRLQPATGLIEALSNEVTEHK